MPTLYRAKHRRPILTDRVGFPEYPLSDVQNDARCTRFGEPACSGMCPRHDAVGYAEHYARHATDSLGPAVGAIPTRWMP